MGWTKDMSTEFINKKLRMGPISQNCGTAHAFESNPDRLRFIEDDVQKHFREYDWNGDSIDTYSFILVKYNLPQRHTIDVLHGNPKNIDDKRAVVSI